MRGSPLRLPKPCTSNSAASTDPNAKSAPSATAAATIRPLRTVMSPPPPQVSLRRADSVAGGECPRVRENPAEAQRRHSVHQADVLVGELEHQVAPAVAVHVLVVDAARRSRCALRPEAQRRRV